MGPGGGQAPQGREPAISELLRARRPAPLPANSSGEQLGGCRTCPGPPAFTPHVPSSFLSSSEEANSIFMEILSLHRPL